MTERIIRVSIDPEVSAAYLRVSDAAVKRTVEVSDVINVDLDEHRMVRGIELLDLDAIIPYDELERLFHVDSRLINALKTIRPTINGFMGSLQAQRETVDAVPRPWVNSGHLQGA